MSQESSENKGRSTLKILQDELDLLNRRGKSKPIHTIESSKTFQDFGASIGREELYKTIKELYNFSKRAMEQVKIREDNAGGGSTNVGQLGDMIKTELASVLPGMLKTALADFKNSDDDQKVPCSHDQPKNVSHTLQLEKKVDESKDAMDPSEISKQEWTEVVKKDIKGKLKNVPVMKTSVSKTTSGNSTTKLHFQSKDDLDRATKALENKYKVTSKSEDKKLLNPKLTISGLDPDIKTKETLVEELINKNDFLVGLEDDIKGIFVDDKERFGVIEVSTDIREAIRKNSDKVCLGLERYTVKDRFHVIQCYHCQEYGHTSKSDFCKSKEDDPTCFYCAGRHSSKDCQKKKDRDTKAIKCSNCSKSKNRSEKDACTSHKASDKLCPAFVREKERIMSRTACSEEAKNSYRQRIRETKQKLGRV